jgi:hypothetical protein
MALASFSCHDAVEVYLVTYRWNVSAPGKAKPRRMQWYHFDDYGLT